jgi:Anti-sigma factor NepR
MSDEDQRRPAPTLDLDTMMAIGRELRQMYADIIAEGVPERFAEILRRLDEPNNVGSKNDPTPPSI